MVFALDYAATIYESFSKVAKASLEGSQISVLVPPEGRDPIMMDELLHPMNFTEIDWIV